ncbi:hypothetical protein [Streptomyces youssoufiensis]
MLSIRRFWQTPRGPARTTSLATKRASDELPHRVGLGVQAPIGVDRGGLSPTGEGGEEVFELYYETQNPKVPPPQFTFYRDGEYACGFHMYMHTWSHEVTGPDAALVQADIEAAGIHNEDRRESAHLTSLTVIEKRFTLTLPMNQILHGSLPAALVHGHHASAKGHAP